ncbi:hypothetical protein L6452_30848 [Arctium lappa]|uniref:Uncharacterized protein n=1 Tax=Arctium lappa TaxID=4217 RepID=A0ACB8ZK86_ARCLA|nr:hypothetical protein L6452_30848 [Arctium lappa]
MTTYGFSVVRVILTQLRHGNTSWNTAPLVFSSGTPPIFTGIGALTFLPARSSSLVTFDETSFPLSDKHPSAPFDYSFLESDPSLAIFDPPATFPPTPLPPAQNPSSQNTSPSPILQQAPPIQTYHRRNKQPPVTTTLLTYCPNATASTNSPATTTTRTIPPHDNPFPSIQISTSC